MKFYHVTEIKSNEHFCPTRILFNFLCCDKANNGRLENVLKTFTTYKLVQQQLKRQIA